MSTLHKLSGFLGRGFLLFSAAVSLHWASRICVGLGHWEGHFKHPIGGGLLFRYVSSPLVPLTLVASALFLLALGKQQRGFRRAVGVFTLALSFLALFTPDGFAHDMGHCLIEDCSEEVGLMHLARCGCIVAVGFLGLALTDFGCKSREPGASPNVGPTELFGNSSAGAGPPSVSRSLGGAFMIGKRTSVLIVLALGALLVGGRLVSGSLLRSPSSLRTSLLRRTPLGTSSEATLAVIRKRGWTITDYRHDQGFMKQDSFALPKIVGVRSVTADLGHYWLPFRTDVEASWGFDGNDRLIDIWVRKSVDAL